MKNTEIYGIYIVNHQRYLPPTERTNPPFNGTQIKDAVSANRGMTTTWELFKLYSKITAGIIQVDDARELFYQPGLIEFRPSDKYKIGKISEVHNNGNVIIFKSKSSLTIGDKIIVENKNDGCIKVKIESIQLDGKNVSASESGEVGLKINNKSFTGSTVWKY